MLVEAALLLPIFFAVVLAMFTFGSAYLARISLEDAVRDGARFASTVDAFADDGDPAAVNADEQVVIDRIRQLAAGQLETTDPICVQKTTATGLDTSCGLADPSGSVGDEVIKVSASTDHRIEVLFFSRTISLEAEAVATYER